MIELSVVIPSYRSKQTIELCLNALMNQSLRKDAYEVIIVDSSDDVTDEIIRQKFSSLKLIHLSEKTLAGEARNIGVKYAVGKYIAFVDSDCVADPFLLKGMLEHMKNESYAGVGGGIRNGTPGSLAGSVEYLINFKDFTPQTPLGEVSHIPSCNLCLRRDIFEKYGPFPTDFFPGEDRVLNWRICQAGEKYLFDPGLTVTHLNRTTFKKVFDHQIKYGRAFAITRSRFPMPGRIFVIFPLFSLAIPFARWAFVLFSLRFSLKLLGMALVLSPWVLTALIVWATGFWRQLEEIETRQVQDPL